jgi:molybdate transport system substrate-binding protein
MVKTGNVPAGFVALSQMREQQIPIGQYTLIDEQAHQSIYQGVVQLKNGLHPAQARDFLHYLISRTGQARAANLTTPNNAEPIDR